QLDWNADERQVSLGLSCEEADHLDAERTGKRIEQNILHYVSTQTHCTQEAIINSVRGKVGTKKQVLQSLIDAGCFIQSGGGVKGDPYTYVLKAVESESVA